MDKIPANGKALADHWRWAAQKGLMNPNTANALRAACTQVLGVDDNWENLDITKLDIDDLCRRFQNKRSKDFTPGSLETYKRRFQMAVKSFLEYVKDPSSWKSPAQGRVPRKERKNTPVEPPERMIPGFEQAKNPSSDTGFVDYPFPLREGRMAYLKLPTDLKTAEVKRLNAFLSTLAVDSE